jgi:hypothetical protein
MLHVPHLGKGIPLVIARWAPSGLAYFRHLEGFLLARGESMEPFLVQYLPLGQVLTSGSPLCMNRW